MVVLLILVLLVVLVPVLVLVLILLLDFVLLLLLVRTSFVADFVAPRDDPTGSRSPPRGPGGIDRGSGLRAPEQEIAVISIDSQGSCSSGGGLACCTQRGCEARPSWLPTQPEVERRRRPRPRPPPVLGLLRIS